MKLERSCGILMHISSLPNKYGIGTMGKEAYNFIDFLAESKQRFWQILPLGPTDNGNSPYQTYSIFAGNTLLISLEQLAEEGLLTKHELDTNNNFPTGYVDFDKLGAWKNSLLHKAFLKFNDNSSIWNDEYNHFLKEHSWWLTDYALFMSLKANSNKKWNQWELGIKEREKEAMQAILHEHSTEINYHRFLQFIFFRQWFALKKYANLKGVLIFGDIPLYVSFDSSDVWANPDIFELDAQKNMTHIAGVPPDYFSKDGQLWGAPVFNWNRIKERNYDWWIARLHFNLNLFNYARIDHFRGLESFWSVPATEKTAINGKWIPANGREMLSLLQSQIGTLPIIAEDLGIITQEVEKLRDDFGLAGMKVLQFAFASDEKNVHLPHNYQHNFIVYTGTHDNNTTLGWLSNISDCEQKNIDAYYSAQENITPKCLIETALASVANVAIIPMQDLLELNSEHRMNTPGTITNNWIWRMEKHLLKDEHKNYLLSLTKKYNRIPNVFA